MIYQIIQLHWPQWISHTHWGKLALAVIVGWLLIDFVIFAQLRRFKKIKADLDKFHRFNLDPEGPQGASQISRRSESGIRARDNLK